MNLSKQREEGVPRKRRGSCASRLWEGDGGAREGLRASWRNGRSCVHKRVEAGTGWAQVTKALSPGNSSVERFQARGWQNQICFSKG